MKIHLKNLSKHFKNVIAVHELDLIVEDGEMICLLGPSGCGKSTTLSMIAGLEKPTRGDVYFNGRCVTDLAAEERNIGMVFQNYALYPHMTVAENIMFPLKMLRVSKKNRIERVKKIAEMMHFQDLLNRRPNELSGGQQQRVAIARALIKEPEILLLDEPFSNLDARLRIQLRDEIRSLQRELGITTIFVTHDQEEAMSISDNILLLNQGRIQQYSSPQNMYQHPANLFVASFMGNPPMNLIECSWNGANIVLNPEAEWDVSSLKPEVHLETGSQAILGIRPEDLQMTTRTGQLQGMVKSVQTLGKEVYLKVQSGPYELIACIDWDHPFEEGNHLNFNIRRSYLFPQQVSPEIEVTG